MEEKIFTAKDILKAVEKVRTEPFGVEDRRVVVRYDDLCAVFNRYEGEIKKLLCKNAELEVRCEGILKDYYAECQTCDEQKDEIKRLTEENKKLSIKVWSYEKPARTPLYSNESMVNCNFVPCYNENSDLKAKNAELQKQVNELKVYLASEKVCSKQVVKDTAKKIYGEINSCIEKGQEYCGTDWRGLLTAKTVILVWCKKHGVEVE